MFECMIYLHQYINITYYIQLPEDPNGLMYNKKNRDYASRRLIGFYAEGTSRTVANISDEIFAHQFGADLTRPLLSGFDDKI